MDTERRHRGDRDADGKGRAGRPHRKPVARGPQAQHDAGHHQQHAKDRGARRIVGGDEGERYYIHDHYASFYWIWIP